MKIFWAAATCVTIWLAVSVARSESTSLSSDRLLQQSSGTLATANCLSPSMTPIPQCGGGGGGCFVGCQCIGGCTTPIILDTGGNGFVLTSVQDGVQFDIVGNGTPIQMAWTAPNEENAFLALDRNGNGIIDDGTELFGSFTPQPPSQDPNGFLALAVFDSPQNGGNGDGLIDSRDAIYKSLLLWTDTNHDGVCQPEELHTLPSMGVYSIALDYHASMRRDQFGNVFRYGARVNSGSSGTTKLGRTAYDVLLTTAAMQ